MPGVAFGEAAEGEPQATHRAMNLDGLGGVVGAAWVETAMVAEQWAEQVLVNSDQSDEERAHRRSPMRFQWAESEVVSVVLGADGAGPRHVTTGFQNDRLSS